MAVSKAKKAEILETLEAHLKESVSVAFTSNNKMTVLDVTTMKKELRTHNTVFMLAKKTLIRLAFKNVFSVDLNIDTLPGQVAIVISKGDKVAGFSVVSKYATEWKKEEKLKFVGGYFDGVVLDEKAMSRIANLPSREVLLAKLLGSMMSPLSGLARFLDGAKGELEKKGLTKVADLTVPAKEEAPAPVAEAPKAEETPAPAVEEAKAEETAPVAAATEETPAEEAPAA